MEKYIKNVEHNQGFSLADSVDYLTGQIVSKTLSQNRYNSLTLFAFDKDEEISAHESDGDAMVTALDGKAKITIADKEYIVTAGETIVMPAKTPHAVYALEPFKMFLIVIFPENR
ncbi:MAG: cupin domain-containing protein [Anaerovoracaceae bacterium]|jgi:quercetin dioxygenase-like cupin family protein